MILPEADPDVEAYDRSVTGTSEQTVRPATAADVKPLATVMARAFYDDPPFIWMLPDPATRLERARPFERRCGFDPTTLTCSTTLACSR